MMYTAWLGFASTRHLLLVVRMLPMKDVVSGYLQKVHLPSVLARCCLNTHKPDPEALLDHRVQFCIRRNAGQNCSVSASEAQQ